MLEKNVVNKIQKYWKKQGAVIFKFHGNMYTQAGVPDLLICYEGNFIGIEVKVGNNKPRPLQLRNLEIINEWGKGFAFWCNENDYLEKSENIIKKIKKN